jgi:hypothetical protein
MAARWVSPDPASPVYKAFEMYRNYDGKKSTFGDVGVSDAVPNPDELSSFAAERTSDGALTVMIVNKSPSKPAPVTIKIANFSGNGIAQAWRLTSANEIKRVENSTVNNNILTLTAPAQSITLLVLPKYGVIVPKPTVPQGLAIKSGNASVLLTWAPSAEAESYRISRSASASGPFAPVATVNELSYIDNNVENGKKYYYTVKALNSSGASASTPAVDASPSDRNRDPSRYNFESGTQGWASSGGMIVSVTSSIEKSFQGAASLAVKIDGDKADKQTVHVQPPLPVPAGSRLTFHVWIPEGSRIASVQPYAIQNKAGNWGFNGAWTPIANIKPNAWNTLSFDLPANAAPLYQLGVEFTTDSAWSGTCYIDSITW